METMQKQIINLTLKANRAHIRPAAYLDGSFPAYRDACKRGGALYSFEEKENACALDLVQGVVEQLRLAGFEAVVSQELADAIRAKAKASYAHIEEARDRIKAVDDELKKRGLELYPFQKEGVQWLAGHDTGVLADEMGLGKTIQALISLPKDAPVLVVCPASLKGNWKNEIRKWRPDFMVGALAGRGSWRWPAAGEIVIVNYDILPEEEGLEKKSGTLATEFFEGGRICLKGTVLIGDEAHAVKNSKAQRTKRFRKISELVRERGGRTWGLTGTPLLNRPLELWYVLHAFGLAEKAFRNFNNFCTLFGGSKTSFGVQWDSRPSPGAAELLKVVMLKRDREVVLPQLPTKTWRTIEVDIDRETSRLCDQLTQKILDLGKDVQQVVENQGIEFEDISAVRAALARAKIPALKALVEDYEENEQSLVVFSAHREPVDMLADRPGWATITGDTPVEKRSEIVDAFQGGRLKGLALTIQAGGVGLTLTRAHECIFVDLLWTPALNAQAEDRLCRIGQDRGVVVTVLTADHEMDRRVNEILMEKRHIIRETVDKAAVENVEVRDPGEDPLAGVTIGEAAPARSSGGQNHAPSAPGGARGPATELEKWASAGVQYIAANDIDLAYEVNGVGFNKFDSQFGHKMAEFCRAGKATEGQWAAIVKLANRYRRQLPKMPEPKKETA